MTLIFDAAHGIEDDKQQVELINALTDTLRRFHTAHLSRCVAVRVAVAHASGPEAGY